MSSTLDMAIEEAERQGATRIIALKMKVGALSGVVPDALMFSFDMLAAGTLAEGARLDIESISITCTCPGCKTDFQPRDYVCVCPGCGTFCQDVQSGRELELSSMEVDYEPHPH